MNSAVLCQLYILAYLLQVVSPYSAEDAKGLLKAAIRDPDPGSFIIYHIDLFLICNHNSKVDVLKGIVRTKGVKGMGRRKEDENKEKIPCFLHGLKEIPPFVFLYLVL